MKFLSIKPAAFFLALVLAVQFFAGSARADFAFGPVGVTALSPPSDTGAPPDNVPATPTPPDNSPPSPAPPDNVPVSPTPPDTTSAPPAPDTPPPVIGGPPVSGMVLTFDDEFNNLSASSSGMDTLWETKFYYNSIMHSNWSNFDLDPAVCGLGLTPYSLENGILDIHEQTTDPRLTACGVTNPYTSGNLYSYYSFSQEYGYFEMRAQASNVAGTNFAFWMLPEDGSWPPEIDMPEMLGRTPSIDHLSNHTGADNTTISFPVNAGTDLSAGFHVYGVLWDPDSITWFLDGTPVAKTPTQSDEHKPFYLILGLGVGSCNDGWAGCPEDPQHFSADVYVDYVRAWQFEDQNPAACIGDCTASQ